MAQQLRSVVQTVEPRLTDMKDSDTGTKPGPETWSKKEILGHLIDSAANNHQRFVRALYNAADQFPTYEQERWVAIQRHNEQPWPSLVTMWADYNIHMSHVIECVPEDTEGFTCNIGTEAPVSLELAIKDYLSHLKLHLKDILDDSM